ncbi:MAG TPA: DMT family transporter [Allosphingosinicella sp.]|jgi:drug/metabolite transporter (DMT)-like permease|nr:DMT family transporter [Allosphingosinicella sp.]
MNDTPPPLRQNRLLGIALRVGAATCFGFMAAMIKLGSEAGVSLPELAFYRFAFGLPPLLIWIALTGSFGAWRTRRPLAHLWRGTIGLSTMVTAFAGLTLLPLAEAATIGFVAPLFSVALSALILSEKVGRHRWTAVVLGLIGVVIVMRPGGGHVPALGLALALLAALGTAGVTITLRTIGRTERTPTIVLWFTCFAIAVTGLFLPFYGQAHDAHGWAILAALGLFGGLGQLFLTSSLRFAPVPVVVPFDYSQLLWAVLLGWVLWATHPPASTWAGAAVIVASGLYTLYREHKLGKDEARAARAAEPL